MFQHAVYVVLASAVPALAQVVSYEGTSFPDAVGWVRSDSEDLADRWLEDGWFWQYAEIVDPGPPQIGEQDYYRWDLDAQAGVSPWFVQWVMESDGPREGFPNVSPAALVASGQMGVNYHFTIALDQVRLIDPDLAVHLFDIEPGPHVYRLEVFPETYVFRIDGAPVINGVPPGPYPTSDSVIKFGVCAGTDGETTRWDYITFGALAEPIPTVSAWGLVTMMLLILTGGTFVLRHRSRPFARSFK